MADPKTLRADVQEALRLWHNQTTDTPLHYLGHYQHLLDKGFTPQQAANQLLSDGLAIMAEQYPQEAQLLQLRFADGMVMSAVANRLAMAESTANRKQRQAIDLLSDILYQQETDYQHQHLAQLEQRLNLPIATELIGVEPYLNQLEHLLHQPDGPWIVSIEGLGGLGKTTLASQLVRNLSLSKEFRGIGWVSAQQQAFLANRIQDTPQPALTVEVLVDKLLKQLWNMTDSLTVEEKVQLVRQYLKADSYLVVLDNLETVTDYETILPVLRQWSNPSRFLLTTRHSLCTYTGVYCFSLSALSEADGITFMRHEAKQRGITAILEAETSALQRIYQVTGGNPLALKLVIGQLSMLPLGQVLTQLKEANQESVEALYNYIYWQAWQLLQPVSKQVLLVMPLANHGGVAQLQAVSNLSETELAQGIQQLRQLSLLNIHGGLQERLYSIHRLTETFLLHEVTKWQS